MKKDNAIQNNIKTVGITLISMFLIIVLFSYAWQATQDIQAGVSSTLSAEEQEKMDIFAQCLRDKKLTMYGASWCSHCKKEKANFGSSFSFVPYVECPDNAQLCLDKGITGYPTWITADGVKYTGEQGLDTLASISGCSLE